MIGKEGFLPKKQEAKTFDHKIGIFYSSSNFFLFYKHSEKKISENTKVFFYFLFNEYNFNLIKLVMERRT